jgi:hypothetical protein
MAATTSYIGLEGRVAVDGQHLSIRHTRLTIPECLDRCSVQGGSDRLLLKRPPSNASPHMSFQRENLKVYRIATINALRQYRVKGRTTSHCLRDGVTCKAIEDEDRSFWAYLSTHRQALC